MKADDLLRHYTRIADAPAAVARLRRFILDLAVRGKLVRQEPTDEPAASLLSRVASEKARLLKCGEISKGKALTPFDDVGIFDLPASWQWTKLGNVTSHIQRGKSPKYSMTDGLPIISQRCVQWRGLDMNAAKLVTLESLENYEEARFIRDGDLLWNSTGTGTIGRIILVFNPPAKLVCDSHVTVVRCLVVLPEYIRTWLRSDSVYSLIEDRAAGSTNQVELTAQMAINQIVPLPPLAEQHCIVAKVNELMALCDQLDAARAEREAARDRLAAASLARLHTPDPEIFHDDARFALAALPALTARPDQIKQLRQTILNLAARGKLVPQDPKDEPTSELLKRISKLKQRPAQHSRQRRDLKIGVGDAPLLWELPQGWEWTSLGEITLDLRYGTAKKCYYQKVGVPVLRIPNVSSGKINLDNLKFGPLTESERAELELRQGDLLIIRSNGSLNIVGRAAEVGCSAEGMFFAGYLVRVRLSVLNILPRYVWLTTNTDDVRDQIEIPIRSTVGLKNVNSTELSSLRFPLPPLAEQSRIVAKVDELMALCDRLEASLSTGEDHRRRLLEALLQQALQPAGTLAAAA